LAPRRWWITTHFVVVTDDHPTALADVTADGASKDGYGHVPLVTPASQRLLA
jgi:hypothetical protein